MPSSFGDFLARWGDPSLNQQSADAQGLVDALSAQDGSGAPAVNDRPGAVDDDGTPAASDLDAQTFKNGRLSEQLADNNPGIYKRLGISPEAFKSLSARQKVAAVNGVITAETFKQTLAKTSAAQLQNRAAQFQQRQQQNEGSIFGNLLQGNDPGTGVSGPITAAGLKAAQEGRFNAAVSAAPGDDGGPTPQAATAMAGAAPADLGAPAAPAGSGLNADMITSMARRAGMSPADTMQLGREALYSAKAKLDLAKAAREGGPNAENIDTFSLPNGQSAVSLRGSKQLQLLSDPNKLIDVQPIVDPDTGEPTGATAVMHPNGKGMTILKPSPTKLPNPAQTQKLTVDSLVEGEKAMRGIDDDIAAWQNQARNASAGVKDARGNPMAAPDPAELQDLRARRQRLTAAMGGAQLGGAPAAPAGTGKPLTPDVAKQLLQQAGGDKTKARAIAKQLGYQF